MEQQGEQVYHIKFDMVLTVLQANRQTCQIWAKVSPGMLAPALGNGKLGRGKDKSPCIIELLLRNGQVVTAVIRDPSGQTLALGEVAIAACRRCGDLSWTVRPMSLQNQDVPEVKHLAANPGIETAGQWPSPKPWSQRAPPRWTHALLQEEVDMLPRRHRQVLLLINGKRGFEELCRVLNCTSDQLAVIFNDLMTRNLIFFPPDDK